MKKSRLSEAISKFVEGRRSVDPTAREDCSWSGQAGNTPDEKKASCRKCASRNKRACDKGCERTFPPGSDRANCKKNCVCQLCRDKKNKCGEPLRDCKRACPNESYGSVGEPPVEPPTDPPEPNPALDIGACCVQQRHTTPEPLPDRYTYHCIDDWPRSLCNRHGTGKRKTKFFKGQKCKGKNCSKYWKER